MCLSPGLFSLTQDCAVVKTKELRHWTRWVSLRRFRFAVLSSVNIAVGDAAHGDQSVLR